MTVKRFRRVQIGPRLYVDCEEEKTEDGMKLEPPRKKGEPPRTYFEACDDLRESMTEFKDAVIKAFDVDAARVKCWLRKLRRML